MTQSQLAGILLRLVQDPGTPINPRQYQAAYDAAAAILAAVAPRRTYWVPWLLP